jgi:hypothetical protein
MADILQKVIADKFEDHLSSGDPRTMKRDIFSELMDGLDALSKERHDNLLEEDPCKTDRRHEGQTHTSRRI